MSSSRESGRFPVCKNCVYASAYVLCPDKSSLTCLKALCGFSRVRRTEGSSNDYDFLLHLGSALKSLGMVNCLANSRRVMVLKRELAGLAM